MLLAVFLYWIPQLTKSNTFNSGCNPNWITVGRSEAWYNFRTRISVLQTVLVQTVKVVFEIHLMSCTEQGIYNIIKKRAELEQFSAK